MATHREDRSSRIGQWSGEKDSRSASLNVPDAWRQLLLFAIPIVAFVTYLFYTWFAVMDRYQIFLYFHAMGPGFDTTPFGEVTVGRYWMSGLVASGAVMVPYALINLILGRTARSFRGPDPWRLWVACAVPLLITIPSIVTTVNDPALPFRHAAQVTGVLLVGLALVTWMGPYAATRPVPYLLLMFDGVGLAGLLMFMRAHETFCRVLDGGNSALVYRFLAVLAAGIGLVIVLTAVYRWWHRVSVPDSLSWVAAGASIHYLFLPIYHYLCWCKDDGSWLDADYFPYIPSVDNYFSTDLLFQIGAWAVVGVFAVAVTRLRLALAARGPANAVAEKGARTRDD